jgi:hypothetical protein
MAFFLQKKKQKTCANLAQWLSLKKWAGTGFKLRHYSNWRTFELGHVRQLIKVFLLLFLQKKNNPFFLYQPPWRLTHRKQGKAFFFEKKKQKAFVCAVADLAGKVRVSTRKSFLVLFLEKGLLACYESWSRPAGITPCEHP